MGHQPELIKDHPQAGSSLTRARVTDRLLAPNLFGVPTSWPADAFRDYLRALMDAAGIPDYAELSRLSGVSQTQFSHWRRGNARPSRESLAKIAPILGVAAVSLWLAADLANPDELALADAPDMRVLPREIRELADLFDTPGLTEEQKSYVRRSVSTLTAGLRAELVKPRNHPTGRRKVG